MVGCRSGGRHPEWGLGGRRWLRRLRDPVGADRRAARPRGRRPRSGVEQLRPRRLGPGTSARRRSDPPDGGVVRRGEQGVRPPVPRRRARGRAHPPGHPRRAAPGRRLGHPGVLHGHRRRHPGRRGRPALEVRRPRRRRDRLARQGGTALRRDRLRPGGGHRVRRRAGPRLEGRPARQPRLQQVRAQLQPAGRDGRPGHHRRGRAPRRTGRPGPRRDPHPRRVRAPRAPADSASRRPTSGSRSGPSETPEPPTPQDRRHAHELDPRADGGPCGRRADRRFVREPRDRAADTGAQPRPRRHRDRPPVRERHPRLRRLPHRRRGRRRPDQRRQGDRHRAERGVVLRLRDLLRHDPRRQGRRGHPRGDAGQRRAATSPTG